VAVSQRCLLMDKIAPFDFQLNVASPTYVIQAIPTTYPFLGLEYPNRVPASAIARPWYFFERSIRPKKRMGRFPVLVNLISFSVIVVAR
jgi:hypothetical protein